MSGNIAANFMKSKWPTLKGRLMHPLTNELEALLQIEKTMLLSKLAKKRLKKLLKFNAG